MEMSSDCLRQEPIRIGKPVRGPHGGWQKQEIDTLQKSIDEAAQTGESLRSVFDRMGEALGRKPNSIRNFYYAQIRAQSQDMGRALPFETFSQEEVEQLIKSVLTARAQGMSVRACVRRLAGGDRTLMLRYQNKYRSTIRTRPELVKKVMEELSLNGVPFVSPYAQDQDEAESTLENLEQRAAQSGDPQLRQLFSSLDHLLTLALTPRETPQSAAALPADSEVQRRADRLSAHVDVLRIALDDEQIRRAKLKAETEQMVTLIKEYIALPEQDRSNHASIFCSQAAARLSAVECALMEE